jgi:predicted O-linked N-acetylglucosamine transferase (SPINDLY family)
VNSHFQAIIIALSLATGASFVSVASSACAEDVKVPESVADHMALAKQYTEKAASYKAEAEHHRKMAAAYKASVATTPKAPPNPWAVKMEKHCMALVKDAEKLAADAQKAAEFHTLRAKELEGK